MATIEIVTQAEYQALVEEVNSLRALFILWIENTDDEIKGYKAAAKFLGVSVSTMERLVRERKVPYLKHGKSVSFSRKVLVSYKQNRRIKASA